jgi:microcystin degradation protein MlrC
VSALQSAEEGSVVDVTVGGRLDPARGASLPIAGARLLRKTSAHGIGRAVVLQKDHVTVVVVEGPAMAVRPLFYTAVGLDPWRADIIVVKNFFPFRMFFLAHARLTLYVRTRGVTDFDAAYALTFDGPMHPRDAVSDWREADRRRRTPHAVPLARERAA